MAWRLTRFPSRAARNFDLFRAGLRRPVARLRAFPHSEVRQGGKSAMTGIGHVLTVYFIGLIVATLGLWAGARARRDGSFVHAFWPLGMVLLAWGSSVEAGLAGQANHVLPTQANPWGLRR